MSDEVIKWSSNEEILREAPLWMRRKVRRIPQPQQKDFNERDRVTITKKIIMSQVINQVQSYLLPH